MKGTRAMYGFLEGSPSGQVAEGDPTQRLFHIPSLVVGEKVGDEFVVRVLLFVEYGFLLVESTMQGRWRGYGNIAAGIQEFQLAEQIEIKQEIIPRRSKRSPCGYVQLLTTTL